MSLRADTAEIRRDLLTATRELQRMARNLLAALDDPDIPYLTGFLKQAEECEAILLRTRTDKEVVIAAETIGALYEIELES